MSNKLQGIMEAYKSMVSEAKVKEQTELGGKEYANIELCPMAVKAFKKDLENAENPEAVHKAIQAVDDYLAIERKVMDEGEAEEEDVTDIKSGIAAAKNAIKDAGLTGHDYHQSHLDKVMSMLEDEDEEEEDEDEEEMNEEVELEEDLHARYMRAHGKKASGKGNWMFTTKSTGDVDHKDMYHTKGQETLSKAAADARKHFGTKDVYVMEEVELDEARGAAAPKMKGNDGPYTRQQIEKAAAAAKVDMGAKSRMMMALRKMNEELEEEVELEEKLSSKEKMKRGLYNQKMDPVDKKALKKDFDARADKDIDNDGDVDNSDEYLHKRRKAVSKAMSKEKKDDKKNPHTSDKVPEISKIDETFEELWTRIEEASDAGRMKTATKPEGIMDKESPKSKEFADKHTVEVRDDLSDALSKTTEAGRGGPGPKARDGDNLANGDRKSEMQAILDVLRRQR